MIARHSLFRFPVLRLFLLVLVLMLVLVGNSPTLAQERSYSYERIDVTLDIDEDGTLAVNERTTFRFQGGEERPFTRAYREIKHYRLDDIDTIRVYEESSSGSIRNYTERNEERPGSFAVDHTGDGWAITWYYIPVKEGERTFIVSYEVDGVVRNGDEGDEMDEIWWVAIFPERDVPVEKSSVTLHLPEDADLRMDDLEINLPSANASTSIEENTLIFERDEPLPPGRAFDVRVRFPADMVDSLRPDWQREGANEESYLEKFAQNEEAGSSYAQSNNSQNANTVDTNIEYFALIMFMMLMIVVILRGKQTSHTNGRRRRRSGDEDYSSSSSSSSSRSNRSRSSGGSSFSSGSSSSKSSGGSGGGRGGAG